MSILTNDRVLVEAPSDGTRRPRLKDCRKKSVSFRCVARDNPPELSVDTTNLPLLTTNSSAARIGPTKFIMNFLPLRFRGEQDRPANTPPSWLNKKMTPVLRFLARLGLLCLILTLQCSLQALDLSIDLVLLGVILGWRWRG